MNPVPFIPAKRRVQRRRKNVPVAGPPGPGYLVARIGGVNSDAEHLYVAIMFDTSDDNPLNPVDSADPGKWWGRHDGANFVGQELVLVSSSELAVLLTYVGPNEGEDVIGYTNAPSDISDASGRTLVAFSIQY